MVVLGLLCLMPFQHIPVQARCLRNCAHFVLLLRLLFLIP